MGEGEGGFEEDVGLVPVDVVRYEDGVGFGVEGDVLGEVRLLPGAGNADGLAEGAVLGESDGVELVDGGHGAVKGAGVDVPGVVLLGSVFVGLELVAAGVGGEEFVLSGEADLSEVMQPVCRSMVSLSRELERVKAVG